MTATRRLAAILAADVAGYSRLMEADEEGTLAQLRAIRTELFEPTIAAHNGRLVKTTGDGLLVEFGSVVDALRCATEVQRAMARRNAADPDEERIEYRIGINVGDIVVEDGDIFGDGVNVAARLEGLADPVRALTQFNKLTQESYSGAVRFARRALDIDASYAPAAALVAYLYVMQVSQGWVRLDRARFAEVRDLAKRAIQDGKDDPDTLWMAAQVIGFAGEAQTALSVVDRAVSLNPNSAHAWMQRGYILCFLNRPETGCRSVPTRNAAGPTRPT